MRKRQRIDDPIGLALAYALDAALFARDRLGFSPDPWQERLLRSTARWLLLNCCRVPAKREIHHDGDRGAASGRL
jgi:hypothetical protein